MSNPLKKDYFWNTVGVFLQNAISPLLLIVVTRVNGIYDSGVFSFAFAISIIFWAFGMWGSRTYQVSDVGHEFAQRSYVMTRIILGIAMLFSAAIFAIVNHYDVSKSSILLALVLFKAIESIADSIHGILQINGKLFIAGRSLTYKAIAGFVVFVIIDLLSRNLFLSVLGIVIVNVLFVLLYDVVIAKRVEIVAKKKERLANYIHDSITIIKRCAPVAFALILTILPINIPRYYVDLYHPEQIGHFGIIVMPITLIALLVALVIQPRIVGLSQSKERKDARGFSKLAHNLLLIVLIVDAIVMLATVLFGIPLLQFVFGTDFSDYWGVLVTVVAGGAFIAFVSVFSNLLTIMRNLKIQLWVLLATNILLITASPWAVGVHGSLGGVIAFTTVSFIQALLFALAYHVNFKRVFHHSYDSVE